MRNHFLGSTMALAMLWAGWSLVSIPAAGQEGGKPGPTNYGGCPTENLAFHLCAVEKAKSFNPPRTPDGKPDFQGYWHGRETKGNFSVEAVTADEPLTRSPIMPWQVTSGMLVDPPDRKLPYQPWAAAIGRKGENFKKYIDPRTACGSPGVPRVVSGLSLILQPPGEDSITFLFEDQGAYRVIPTDGRPHIGKNIKLTNGDSVGRWEGNTLVVDVTNLNGYNFLDDSGNFYSDATHVTERMTMIDPNTMHFEGTIDDPKVYTKPWKIVWPMVRETNPEFEFLEEACREGERDVPIFRRLGYRFYRGNNLPALRPR